MKSVDLYLLLSNSNSDVEQGRYNYSVYPVGLDRKLGPSAIPWSFPVIAGCYNNVWVNLWDFFINLSRSLTFVWSISAGSKYDFPHTFRRNVINLSHWQRKCEAVSIATPHCLHDVSLTSPMMLKRLFKCTCPVSSICHYIFWDFLAFSTS